MRSTVAWGPGQVWFRDITNDHRRKLSAKETGP